MQHTDNRGKTKNSTTGSSDGQVERLVMPIMLKGGKKWDRTIPFSLLNEEWAEINHGQTLKRLAERGGLGACEALAIMDKRRWRKMSNKVAMEMLIKRLDA